MNNILTKLKTHYGLTDKEYHQLIYPSSINDLPAVTHFLNYNAFIDRINIALENNEKILIYGDYDADGILATSILKHAFDLLNREVFTFIPSRYKEGYGLGTTHLNSFKKRGISLIITVDNGISQFEAINEARKLGIDVLVSDHHEIGLTLPDAVAILHPHLTSGVKENACGAYMALVISYGLLGYYDDYLLVLAAMATIGDMMPLVSYNRHLVKLAIALLNEKQYPALVALNEQAYFDEKRISHTIVPKINAVARLSKERESNVLVEFFTTKDVKRIQQINDFVLANNEARKTLVKNALYGEDPSDMDPAVIVVINELEGIIGLVAQHYLRIYQKPVIVFTTSLDNPNILKGSARSRSGFNIAEAFNELDDLALSHGGHAEAGGISIDRANLREFRRRFNEIAAKHPFQPDIETYIEISKQDITKNNYEILRTFAPFGIGFSEPLFLIRDFKPEDLVFHSSKDHVITTINDGVKLLGFNIAREVLNKDEITAVGTFTYNEYRGRGSINFQIDIKE